MKPPITHKHCYPERTLSDPELVEGESNGQSKDLRFATGRGSTP